MQRRWGSMVIAGALALAATACGDDSLDDAGGFGRQADQGGQDADGQPDGDGGVQLDDDAADDFAAAFPGGGGGTLIFDGEEIPIASVTCVLDDDTFSVGTVSDNQFRVFVDRNNPLNDVSAQILDSEFLQWFPKDVQGDEAERDGGTFTSGPKPYFNNSDDRVVEASFTIDCP